MSYENLAKKVKETLLLEKNTNNIDIIKNSREVLLKTYKEHINSYKNILDDKVFIYNFLSEEEYKNLILLEIQGDKGIILSNLLDINVKSKDFTTIENAIFMSYVRNRNVTLEEVRSLTNLDINYIEEYIHINNLVFNDIDGAKVPKEIYLSGDIRKKISIIESSENKEDYIKNLEHLNYIVPLWKESNPKIGDMYVPEIIYGSFLDSIDISISSISYSAVSQKWHLNNVITRNKEIQSKLTFWRCNPAKMLGNLFDNKDPIITKKIDDKEYFDPIETEKAKNILKELRLNFENYILSLRESKDKDVIKTLQKMDLDYNNLYNSIVPLELNGNYDFAIEKLKPTEYQKRAVMKSLLQGNILLDHEVGFGKTLTMAMISRENKIAGRSKKSMMITLKANHQDIVQQIKEVYPNSNIFSSDEQLILTKKNSNEFIKKMIFSSYDYIIITHSQFGMLEQDPEMEKIILDKELFVLENEINFLERETEIASSKMLKKGLLTRQQSLNNKLNSVLEKINKNKDVDIKNRKEFNFGDIGIDMLIVDESQVFKNLGFSTRQNVKGMGTNQTSQNALNLYTAIQTVYKENKEERGIVFASGTPISNSISELYNLMKYLAPSRLEEICLGSYDLFLKNYCKISNQLEVDSTGGYKYTNRLTGINEENMDSIRRDYLNFADIVSRDIGYETSKKLPNSNIINVSVKMTDIQEEINKTIISFLNTNKPESCKKAEKILTGDYLNESQDLARQLIGIDLAKKLSTNPQLIKKISNNGQIDLESPKINKCIDIVFEKYQELHNDKGIQLIFLDSGTSKSSDDESDISTYNKLKKELIRKGINENEIAFIQDFKTDKKKKIFQEKLNNGEYRVAIGGTQNMGTGLNVQYRLKCIHNLDIPWRPSDIDQRNGRGVRQGNMYDEVDIFYYGTAKSLDAMLFNIISIKDKMIKDFKLGEKSITTIDDMSKEEMIAELSGDKKLLILERSKRELNINKIKLTNYETELKDNAKKILLANTIIENTNNRLSMRKKEYENLINKNSIDNFKKKSELIINEISGINGSITFKEINRETGEKLFEIKKDIEKKIKNLNIKLPVILVDSIKNSGISLQININKTINIENLDTNNNLFSNSSKSLLNFELIGSTGLNLYENENFTSPQELSTILNAKVFSLIENNYNNDINIINNNILKKEKLINANQNINYSINELKGKISEIKKTYDNILIEIENDPKSNKEFDPTLLYELLIKEKESQNRKLLGLNKKDIKEENMEKVKIKNSQLKIF